MAGRIRSACAIYPAITPPPTALSDVFVGHVSRSSVAMRRSVLNLAIAAPSSVTEIRCSRPTTRTRAASPGRYSSPVSINISLRPCTGKSYAGQVVAYNHPIAALVRRSTAPVVAERASERRVRSRSYRTMGSCRSQRRNCACFAPEEAIVFAVRLTEPRAA
jgi:hypothetical protein